MKYCSLFSVRISQLFSSFNPVQFTEMTPGLNNTIMSWNSTQKTANGLSSKGNNHVVGNHDLCVKYLLKQRKKTLRNFKGILVVLQNMGIITLV